MLGDGPGGTEGLRSLPNARAEVVAISSVVPEPVLLLGQDASEQRIAGLVEDKKIGGFDVVHLAAHALINDAAPERSAVLLSRTNLPDPLDAALSGTRIFDGLLTVREILAEWNLDADLVTLSACQTGLGQVVSGEGYVGLAYALFQVGARSQLVSLWKVDDEATALLMERFYAGLTGAGGCESSVKPVTEAEALRQAKQWVRSYQGADGTRPFEHPAYWSGFIPLGEAG